MAELRKLTEHCKFGGTLNDALRDRLVCGMKNVQRKLLSESELTLQKAIAIVMETAAKNAIELQHQHRPDPVHKVSKKKDSNSKTSKLEKRTCFHCNRKNNTPEECFFKDEKCRFCSMTGHIERACKKKAQMKTTKQSKKKAEQCENCKRGITYCYYNTVKRADVINITPKIEGKYLKTELDTGSAISVIPIKI